MISGAGGSSAGGSDRLRDHRDGRVLDDGGAAIGRDQPDTRRAAAAAGHHVHGRRVHVLHEGVEHDVPRRNHGGAVGRALQPAYEARPARAQPVRHQTQMVLLVDFFPCPFFLST